MIASERYRYVFVQLPRTGSTAIARELRLNYDGKPILKKHSTYQDFLRAATPEQKDYFVFSCLRNPLDDAVSHYFKCKNDHKGNFTNPTRRARRKGLVNHRDNEIYNYLQTTNADFPTFFTRFYKVTYNNWASLSHRDFDYVIRFERLASDFEEVLKRLGIPPVRPLPLMNQTARRSRSYISYYTPATIPHAKRIFGPFMREWGYEFPREWGDTTEPWWTRLEYDFLNIWRTLYWKHLRYRI